MSTSRALTANVARAATPSTIDSTVVVDQPLPSADQRVRHAAQTDRAEHRAEHIQMARRVGIRVSGTWRWASATTSRAIGTLIMKIDRQPGPWTR